MKDFFQIREETTFLTESWVGTLNDMQDFWNKNAKEFMNQKEPLYPILSRPIDRIVKGGVLVVGLNPASDPASSKQRNTIVKAFNGKQPPVFDKKTRTWRNDDFDKKHSGKSSEKNIRFSILDSDAWTKRGGNSNSKYVKNWNLLFSKLGREDLKSKVMMANLYPFPSKSAKALNNSKKSEMDKLARKYFTELVKQVKPSVVIVAGNDAWNALKPMMGSTKSLKEIPAITKDGKEVNAKGSKIGNILEVSSLSDGTPVIKFMHPSTQSGQPNGPSYKDESKLALIRGVFNQYVDGKKIPVKKMNKKIPEPTQEPPKKKIRVGTRAEYEAQKE